MTYHNTQSNFSNKMGSIFFQGMEEIIGQKGVNAALDSAELTHLVNNYPPYSHDSRIRMYELGDVQTGLEKLYGLQGSQGLALRSGRACFKYGLREFGSQLGLTQMSFKLLPLSMKIRTAAALFAGSLDEECEQHVCIDEDPDCLFLHIERCPICWGRHSESPACHLAVGILQEALYWVSGGKYFDVKETDCIATGAHRCTMAIQKTPVE